MTLFRAGVVRLFTAFPLEGRDPLWGRWLSLPSSPLIGWRRRPQEATQRAGPRGLRLPAILVGALPCGGAVSLVGSSGPSLARRNLPCVSLSCLTWCYSPWPPGASPGISPSHSTQDTGVPRSSLCGHHIITPASLGIPGREAQPVSQEAPKCSHSWHRWNTHVTPESHCVASCNVPSPPLSPWTG